jgi:ABC-type multidrug transport system fused ATPase/permease subunit
MARRSGSFVTLPISDERKEQVFEWFVRLFRYRFWIRDIRIDFDKPWWYIFWQVKLFSVAIFTNFFIVEVLRSSAPLLITFVLNASDLTVFYWLVGGLCAYAILIGLLFYFDPLMQLTLVNSLRTSASRFFLTVDPIAHSTRSSGTIVSKTERAANSFVEVYYNSITILGGLVAIVISTGALWSYGWSYGLVALLSFVMVVVIMVGGIMLKTDLTFDQVVEKDDKLKATSLEALQQSSYIRSMFATDRQVTDIVKQSKDQILYNATSWHMSGYVFTICRVLFNLVFGLLGYWVIQDESIAMTDKVALLITYYLTGNTLYSAGHVVKRITKAIYSIHDFWKFVREFGEQTYPVLEGDSVTKK